MTEYYQVWLSAEDEEQARNTMNRLTNLRLIVGGTILKGPSHFWWKGEEIDMDYCYVMGFTTVNNISDLEEEFKKVSEEEIPMMSYNKINGNEEFLDFIKENTRRD